MAEARAVAGYATNRADGSLEAVFEGEDNAVEDLVAYCANGPEKARVTRLDEIEEEPRGVAGFRVR
jgi:acylphosphatase